VTSVVDTPLAELLLARGLVGRAILGEALEHVRAHRHQDPHLSLGLFLLQRGVLPANVIESALRHLAGEEGVANPPAAGGKGWGHVSTLEDAPAPVEGEQAERLGPYRLLRKLAEGGMGAVYEVEHEGMGGRFALKTMKREACELLGEDALARLQREARLTAAIEHPQVVKIHAANFEGETPYVVQDLLVGGSLQGRIERSGRLSPEEAVEFGARLAEGLAAAHADEILHRDLKPDNVLFNDRGEPVIVDFGLARRVGQNTIDLTQTGEILGTPSYMAPEQAMDATQASASSDVYALGAILYFSLEGRPPFVGETVLETLSFVLTSPPPIAESAPPGLAQAIQRLLAKEPGERPEAAEVPALLRASLGSGSARSGTLNLWLGVIGVLLTLGVVAAALRKSGQPVEATPTPRVVVSPQVTAAPSPRADLEPLLAGLEADLPRHRALAAIDLLRLAPDHPQAPVARRELRRLKREPLATLPELPGHRNLAWLSRDVIAGADHERLFTLDLRDESLKWVAHAVPEGRLPSRVAARGGQAWLSLAHPRQGLFDLDPGRLGQVIEAQKDWPLRTPALVSLALSPSGRWAVAGGAGDLVLYDLEARRASGHLRLRHLPSVDDVQVEKLRFFSEEYACGLLNQRHRIPGEEQPTPVTGDLFLVKRVGAELEVVATRKLGLAGRVLAVGGGGVFAGGDGGSFARFDLEDFAECEPERFGEQKDGVRRAVAVAWLNPSELVSARDVNGPRRLTELGRWRREGEGWSYRKITAGPRLREILFVPERGLLLLSARQSSLDGSAAGSVWYLGNQ
jgi:protein kinase-like protein